VSRETERGVMALPYRDDGDGGIFYAWIQT
jgi:hypothetical protein